MPRKRNAENKGLPLRWKKEGKTFYYQVPKGQEHKWDGKKKFRLGASISEASAVWALRLEHKGDIHTIGDLLDRYELEVVPTKKPASRDKDYRSIRRLREVFGSMRMDSIKPRHVYMYMDKKSKKTIKDGRKVGGAVTAKHEVAVLSHAYSKAVTWGLLDAHPFKGNMTYEKSKGRTRYLTDHEIEQILSVAPFNGSISQIIQCYIRIKLLTALRQNDILKIKITDIKEAGIDVVVNKTSKPYILEWTDALREEIDKAITLRPVDAAWLFCTGDGKPYYDEETGKASGWNSAWRRFVDRVLEVTDIKERFIDSDIRAKVATDQDDEREAQKLLTHSNVATTRKHYLRKPKKLKPAK